MINLRESKNCKIVATVGPASHSPRDLEALATIGVDVFRINFSHGERESHRDIFHRIRAVEKRINRPIGILADLQGPKIRVGVLPDDGLSLVYGEEVELHCSDTAETRCIPVPHPEIFAVSTAGDTLLFDDGRLSVELIEVQADRAKAKVTMPGKLTSRKGLNVPGKRLPVSALTEKDRLDLEVALQEGADIIALSFVQHPDDVLEARELIGDKATLLVKIEKPSAMEHLDEIISLADAVMVARGDLGVELPSEMVPIHQRRIVKAARTHCRPVIVATQMMESMIESVTPTRAESSDVATAVYQGADAVMLSAESAVGRHPPTVVAIMDRIIRAIQSAEDYRETITVTSGHQTSAEPSTAEAMAEAASEICNALNCSAIVAFTATGSTGLRISQNRPSAPVLLLTPSVEVARRARLMWGVTPVVEEDISSYEHMLENAQRLAKVHGIAEGERIVVTAGFPFGRPGKTNIVQVTRV